MEQIVTYVLDKGLSWTVVVVILLLVCRRLYNDKEEIQEKRIAENQKAIEAIAGMTAALSSVKDVINARNAGN